MIKEDIKKALEFCAQDNYYFCGGCSYDDVRNCNDKLKTDALNVIIEQEREIAQLKDGYAQVQEQFAQYQMASDKEIAAQVKQAKIDVLNELKNKMFEREYMGVKYKERIFYESEIDDMIAEVQNAEDKG